MSDGQCTSFPIKRFSLASSAIRRMSLHGNPEVHAGITYDTEVDMTHMESEERKISHNTSRCMSI